MNRRSIGLFVVVFLAGFAVNFGATQLVRAGGVGGGYEDYATITGVTLGTLAVMIVYAAGTRWLARHGNTK